MSLNILDKNASADQVRTHLLAGGTLHKVTLTGKWYLIDDTNSLWRVPQATAAKFDLIHAYTFDPTLTTTWRVAPQ